MKKTVNKLVPSGGQNAQDEEGQVLGHSWGELAAVRCVQMRSSCITVASRAVIPSSLGSFSRTV